MLVAAAAVTVDQSGFVAVVAILSWHLLKVAARAMQGSGNSRQAGCAQQGSSSSSK
jgi:hypothetical protein